MADHSTWLGVHLHYRGDLDALLRDAAGPLVRALARDAIATDFFFLRYWDGGSHLRLRLRMAAGGIEDAKAAVAAHARAYFAANPAPETMTQRQYADIAPMLAARERMAHYLPALRPNNSVEFVPYLPDHERYGTGAALRAVEAHFVDSSRYALAILDRRPSSNQRELACVGLLLLAWYAAGVPDERLPDAVEALCRGWRGGRDLSGDREETELAAVRGGLVRLAETLRGLAPKPLDSGASLHAWAATFGALGAALAEPDRLRVLDTCAHLAANRLGMSMAGEVRLRLLAARAMREAIPDGRR